MAMHHTSLFIRGISFLLMISLFLQPLYGHQQYDTPVENTMGLSQFKYDDIVQYLSELENGNFEGFCSIKEHEAINSWLINMALAGTASDDIDAQAELRDSIEELSGLDSDYELSYFNGRCEYDIMLLPIPHSTFIEGYLCKGWLAKKWRKTKDFIKEHKKEILIGAACIIGVAVVAVAVSYSVGAAAATAAASMASPDKDKESSITSPSESTVREEVITSEIIDVNDNDFPMEENARILGIASAQVAMQKLENIINADQFLSNNMEIVNVLKPENYRLINEAFSTPKPGYSWDYTTDFKENIYLTRGQYALDIKLYDQAISDFDKAIELNSSNSNIYLQRALANFETGNLEKAQADFQSHIELKSQPAIAIREYSLGFGNGLIKGVKDSSKGLIEFMTNIIQHPVATAEQIYESGCTLYQLTKTAQWEEISQCLSPEAYALATLWNDLSFQEKGELSGYVFGKHGADLLIPGATLKIAKTSIQELKLLAIAANAAEKAERTLILESIANGSTKISSTNFSVHSATGIQEIGEIGFIEHIKHIKSDKMFNFTDTALNHMQTPSRWVPMHLMKEVIEHPTAVLPDPRNSINANMYYSQISRNGKLYNIEILYDPAENRVLHFKYDPGPLGPLHKVASHEK